MARNAQEKPDIAELIRLAEASRAHLSREVKTLRRKLDVPARVKTSLAEKPLKWLAGSVGTGFFASLLFRKKDKAPKFKSLPQDDSPQKRKGLFLSLLGITFTVAQPLAKMYLTNWLKQYFSEDRLAPTPRSRRF